MFADGLSSEAYELLKRLKTNGSVTRPTPEAAAELLTAGLAVQEDRKLVISEAGKELPRILKPSS